MSDVKRTVLTVANINNYIKSLIAYDANLSNVYVRGEISDFKRYSSGHAYFSLKDASGVLKCVMFNQYFTDNAFVPADGMRVLAFGSISVYERDGVYQLYVRRIEADGIGALYERLERLKLELAAEGLFDEEHKKSIPLLPRAVAVVTSASGAVIEDIRNVTARRFPNMPIILYPVAVQGAGSAEQIASAIYKANEDDRADVIIVGRGGGSIEDLWSFNEEITARAVYDSRLPVISAVGHETDYSICDMVADLRAPTPSAAAELAVPQRDILQNTLLELERKIRSLPKHNIQLKRAELDRIAMHRCWHDLQRRLQIASENLMRFEDDLREATALSAKNRRVNITHFEDRLRALDPMQVLKRGYAAVKNVESDSYITSASDIKGNDEFEIVMQDGSARVRPSSEGV